MFPSLLVILFVVMVSDVLYRRISNTTNGLVFAVCLGIAGLSTDVDISNVVLGYAVILGPVLWLFHRALLGGGDLKLILALMPIVGFTQLGPFIVCTAIFGLPVAIVTWLWAKRTGQVGEIKVPYGVAISGAALWIFRSDIFTGIKTLLWE